jgi:hypothetical protein
MDNQSLEDYRLNLLNIINFATKENYKYFNRVKNLEITLYKILEISGFL